MIIRLAASSASLRSRASLAAYRAPLQGVSDRSFLIAELSVLQRHEPHSDLPLCLLPQVQDVMARRVVGREREGREP